MLPGRGRLLRARLLRGGGCLLRPGRRRMLPSRGHLLRGRLLQCRHVLLRRSHGVVLPGRRRLLRGSGRWLLPGQHDVLRHRLLPPGRGIP